MTNLIIGCMLIFVFFYCAFEMKPALTDTNAIDAIVGEYAVNDEYGMKLIAHAIRNRGTLKGVYGFHALHNLKEPKKIWELASLAWFETAHEQDPLKGANSFYSFDDVNKKGIPSAITKVYYFDHTGFVFFKSTNHRR